MTRTQAGALVEQLLELSRRNREATERARPAIEAAEERLREEARAAIRAGRIRHLGACGVPESVLAAFRAAGLKQTPPVIAVKGWLEAERPLLVLTGGVGAGKSVAAAWTLLKALRQYETLAHPLAAEPIRLEELDARRGLFVTAERLHHASRYVEGREQSLIDRAATVPWLVLDEVREADFSGKGLERLEDVLGERIERRLRTVLTTNLSQEQLRARLPERMASRLSECATVADSGDIDLRRQG